MQIERITAKEKDELDRREHVYRGNRPFPNIENKTVILVDDGIATGASTRVAICALRQLEPARIVLAVPVAPAATCESLQREVDDLICVFMPQFFSAIGQFYEDFSQVSDQEVMDVLHFSANQPCRLSCPSTWAITRLLASNRWREGADCTILNRRA
jgi:putative phosphoribosyl transferase